jgi:recombination protein RecA
MTKRPRLSAVVKEVNKQVDTDTFLDLSKPPTVDCIPTGSIIVDKVLGIPGIPRGRITELFGGEACGKTTLSIHTAIQAQKLGEPVAFLDYEQAFHHGYAQHLGLNVDDPDMFAFAQPKTFEEGWTIIRKFLEAKAVGLIIVDSVSAMTPRKILNAEIEKDVQLGLMARMMSQFMAETTKKLADSNTAMILINQVRSRIKTSMYDAGPDTDTSGGKALKFYASIRLEMKAKNTEYAVMINEIDGTKDEKAPVSNIVTAINRKNKLAVPYKKADLVVRFGEGIDNLRSLIDIGINLNLVKKSGAWFSASRKINWPYDPELMSEESQALQGMEDVRKYLTKNKDAYNSLVNAIYVKPDDEVAKETKEQEVDIENFAEKIAVEEGKSTKRKGSKTKKEIREKVAVAAAESTEGLVTPDLSDDDAPDVEEIDA